MNSVTKTYESARIKTASNSRIVCMLHDKCVQLVQMATGADCKIRADLLVHAQNIIAELEHALILDDELSQSLFYLYDYCYSLLDSTNNTDLQQALSLLSILKNTFNQLLTGKDVGDQQ